MDSRRPSSDDDDISITSTVGSEPQSEYEVESILAQKNFPSGEAYLVKWAGYPLERATWEPEESFCDPNTLVEWKRKTASGENRLLDVDVEALARRTEEIENAKFDRHRRRRAKRIRLGIPVSPSTDTSGPGSFGRDSDSDLDGFVVDDDVDVEGEDEQGGLQSLRKKRHHPSSNKTNHGAGMAPPPSQPSGPSSRSQASASLTSPSTESPNKKKKGDATSAARTSATNIQSIQSSKPLSPIKRVHTLKSLQINSALCQTRPILRLHTSSSTGPLPHLLPSPAQSQTLVSSNSRESAKTTSQPLGPLIPTGPANKTVFSRARKQNGPKPKLFRNLSFKNRYEKAINRDLTPDIRQLDLRPPREWIASCRNKAPVSESPCRLHSPQHSDGLFVEQDSPRHGSNDGPRFQNSPTRIDGSVEVGSSYQTYPAQHTSGQPSSKPSHEGSSNSHNSETAPPNKDSSPRSSDKAPPKEIGSRFRFFLPTEARVHLRFGPEGKEIGDVRLGGLTKTAIWQLVLLKKHKIYLHFKDVCNLDQYRQLCNRRQNIMFCSGWVIGYDDTSPAVNDLANYLRDNRLAALWYHPSQDISSVVVAFASDCPDWSFLNRTAAEYPTARLRIAVRSSLAPVTSLHSSSAKEAPHHGGGHSAMREDNHSFMNPEPVEPIVQREGKKTALSKLLSAANGSMDIVSSFRQRFDITYDELSTVNTFKKERAARSFYLHFPREVEDEFQLVLRFLKHYDTVAFSNRVEGDWEKFVKTATTGTVLFHQNFIHYETMPMLAKLLRASINVFKISLAKSIKYLDHDSHLQRLFPHGGIILMTEDFMLKDPKLALNVLGWFGYFIERKFPGTWKMFLRPNVQCWLLDLCTSWPDDTLWQMYHMINSLTPEYPVGHYNSYRREGSPDSLDGLTDDEGQHHPFVSTREIPDYGSRREDDHLNIPKGLTQVERDTDHLVEYFAGYALLHAERFRRFVVLTTHKAQPRWQAWTHIEIMHYPEFKQELMKSNSHHATSGTTSSSKNKDKSSSTKSLSERHSISGSGGDRDGEKTPRQSLPTASTPAPNPSAT